MPEQIVAILAWNLANLTAHAKDMMAAFEKNRLIVCGQEKDKENLGKLFGEKEVFVFYPEAADRILDYPYPKRSHTIGHTRNLLALASAILEPAADLVMLDDDISPDEKTREKFETAFGSYDLVHGSYEGCTGNSIYAMVSFFEALDKKNSGEENDRQIEQILGGAAAYPKGAGQTVSGLTGGVMGVSPRLRLLDAFAPSAYPIEDHFYEICARRHNPRMRYVNSNTLVTEMPKAVHQRMIGSPDLLVNRYIAAVRGAAVAKYMIWKLTKGYVTQEVDGKVQMVKVANIEENWLCRFVMAEAAAPKIIGAASAYLQKFEYSASVKRQLERISKLGEKDFLVGADELEGEWRAYEAEMKWFKMTADKIMRNPREYRTKLLGK